MPDRCTCCGRPLLGTYVQDSYGAVFCTDHRNHPRCAYCGRFNPQSRDACGVCQSIAVSDLGSARRLFGAAASWLGVIGVRLPAGHNLPLKLGRLGRFGRHANGGQLGLTQIAAWGLPGIWTTTRVTGITIVPGLPQWLFESTATHELGHAWLALCGARRLPAREEEGFCQLLEHLWLSRFRSTECALLRQEIETSEDPVYGEGFRLMRQRARTAGFPALVRELRRS